MGNEVNVNIPITYLIQIAVCGTMGDGELLSSMQQWAVKEIKHSGHSAEYTQAQEEHLAKLRESIMNTIGKENMDKIDNAISDARAGLQ